MHLLFLSKILMVVKNALRLHFARIFKEKIKQDSCKAESLLLQGSFLKLFVTLRTIKTATV